MSKSINFNTGIKTFAINGDENNVIKINVGDPNLIGRMQNVGKKMNELIERYTKQGILADILEFDAEMKAIIDEGFGADVSSHAFGTMNCMSYVDDGNQFLAEAFVDAIIPLIEEELTLYSENYAKSHGKKIEGYIAEAKELES